MIFFNDHQSYKCPCLRNRLRAFHIGIVIINNTFPLLPVYENNRTKKQFLSSCKKNPSFSNCQKRLPVFIMNVMLIILFLFYGKDQDFISHPLICCNCISGSVEYASSIQCYTCIETGFYCSLPLNLDAGDESNEDSVASFGYDSDHACVVKISH